TGGHLARLRRGHEIQSGIDNCLSITAGVNGMLLSWSVPDESTLDHYTVFISRDGQNLMSLGDYYTGTNSLDLRQFGLPRGIYQLFVKAVGKPSVVNNMSAPVGWDLGIRNPVPLTH